MKQRSRNAGRSAAPLARASADLGLWVGRAGQGVDAVLSQIGHEVGRMLGADDPMEAHKVDSRGIYARGRSEDLVQATFVRGLCGESGTVVEVLEPVAGEPDSWRDTRWILWLSPKPS